MSDYNETRVQSLVSGLLDESLNEAETKELDDILQSSSEARKLYHSYMELHFSLGEQSSSPEIIEFDQGLPSPEEFPKAYNSLKKKLQIFQALAAVFLIVSIIGYTLNDPEIITVEAKAAPIQLATIQSASNNVKWNHDSRKQGDIIFNETLNIKQGHLVLKYENGAEIQIEGPAEFILHGTDSATLNYGNLAAHIPEAAQGFTIDAPKALITDLGTEFALKVSKEGQSEILVYEGEVVSSLLGNDGNTLKHVNLYANESIKIDAALGSLKTLPSPQGFIRINKKQVLGSPVNQNYVNAVIQSKPRAFWRFENSLDGIIPNEINASFPGHLTGSAQILDQALTFEKNTKGAFVIDEPISGINKTGHSIEMWVKPLERSKHNMALASLVSMDPLEKGQTVKHLAYFGLTPQKSGQRHEPFDFWFASRFPARSGNYGVNCYANQAFKDNQWYHLVCIKNTNTLEIYVDGQLANSVRHELGNGSKAYQFFVGQMDYHKNAWQFHGQIDEVALYDRALTQKEIFGHYNSSRP